MALSNGKSLISKVRIVCFNPAVIVAMLKMDSLNALLSLMVLIERHYVWFSIVQSGIVQTERVKRFNIVI